MEKFKGSKNRVEIVTRGPSGRIKSSEFIDIKKPENAGRNAAIALTAVLAAGAVGYTVGNDNSNEAPIGQGIATTSTILPEGGISTTLPTTTIPETTTTTEPETTTTTEALATTTTIPSNTEVQEEDIAQPYANSADGENGLFILHDSDNGEKQIDLSQAIGFTPDADLRISEISPNELDPIPADAADFQAYLNTARDGFGPLAGFTDGTNDYNQYYNNESAPQLPAFSWMVHTGLFVEIPGIGRVEGGESRAAVVIILNRTDDVYRWDTNSVKVIAGFQGWGRIWNGEADEVQETEERLANHYRERLGKGVPETGFIGQCDEGKENCDLATVVTVERIQWGENQDGTPRYQFRLIRAETIPTSSK